MSRNLNPAFRGQALAFSGLSLEGEREILTTPDTMTDNDFMVSSNLTVAGAVAITLPSNAPVGHMLLIRDGKGDAGANNVTISAAAGDTVDGGASIAINVNRGAVLLRKASLTAWAVVAKNYTAGGAVIASGVAFTQTYSTADATIAALTTTALTDNGGGTADGTVASMAAPTTLTDNTGLSGTHDDTLAATTVPAALTENAGAIGGTNDGNLPALVDPAGDAGASVIDGIRENATKVNAIITLLGVMAQNASDQAQKTIEIVTLLTTIQNNFKEVTTQIAAIQADILAMKKNDNKIVDAMQAGGLAT